MKKRVERRNRILNKEDPQECWGILNFLNMEKFDREKVITLEDSWNEAVDNGNIKEMKK